MGDPLFDLMYKRVIEETIIKLYVDKKLKRVEVAEALNCSIKRVTDTLKRNNIEIRKDPKRLPNKKITYTVNENGCWICTSHRKRYKGYVHFVKNHKQIRMHRYIYESVYGPIPEGKIILHSCDNPECINPAHLRAGTDADNARDKVMRGRQPRGEVYGSKLTENQVKDILASQKSARSLAREYGVCHASILKIRKGKSWTHIPR